MKPHFLILLFLFLAACAESSKNGVVPDNNQAEGVVNGGGGKGVACNNSNTIEVLDLYEAKFVYGLKLETSAGSYDENLKFAMGRFMRHFNWDSDGLEDIEEVVKSAKKLFDDKVTFLPQGARLKKTQDSFDPIVAEGCEVVQIAVYYNEEKILIDKEYWNRLSPLNQVALFMHEILYKMDRDEGAKDSREARKFVGRMFSQTPLTPLYDGVPVEKDKVWKCIGGISGQTPIFDFVMYESTDERNRKQMVLQFVEVGSRRVLGLTRAFVMGGIIQNGVGSVSLASEDSRFNSWFLDYQGSNKDDGVIKMRLLKKDKTLDSTQFTNVYCRRQAP